MRTFAEGWESYRKKVVPRDAGPVQVRESRLAFYAGAVELFGHLGEIADAPSNPTQFATDEARLEAVYREIMAYCKEIDA